MDNVLNAVKDLDVRNAMKMDALSAKMEFQTLKGSAHLPFDFELVFIDKVLETKKKNHIYYGVFFI